MEEVANQLPSTESSAPQAADLSTSKGIISFVVDNKDGLVSGSARSIVNTAINDHIKILTSGSKWCIVPLLHGDDFSIDHSVLDDIYAAITPPSANGKPLLLVLNSSGGFLAPAYLISKRCKNNEDGFGVAVPRRAKSAATLIALGASEIHMGDISELGPIDPQIRGLPALAVSDSVSYLAGLAEKHPKASNMIASYLAKTLEVQTLGHLKRLPDSAADYARRLLEHHGERAATIADQLTTGYKDHGFVIDKEEAETLLGDIVKSNTDEYKLADKIYLFLEEFFLFVSIVTKRDVQYSVVGTRVRFRFMD